MLLLKNSNRLQSRYVLDTFCIQFEIKVQIHVLSLFYKALQGFYNVSKTTDTP